MVFSYCKGRRVGDHAPCRIFWKLDAFGYCEYRSPYARQCRGFASTTGARYRIRWELNADQLPFRSSDDARDEASAAVPRRRGNHGQTLLHQARLGRPPTLQVSQKQVVVCHGVDEGERCQEIQDVDKPGFCPRHATDESEESEEDCGLNSSLTTSI